MKPSEVKLHNNDDDDRNYTFLMQKSFANDLRNSTEMQNKRQIHNELLLCHLKSYTTLQFTDFWNPIEGDSFFFNDTKK